MARRHSAAPRYVDRERKFRVTALVWFCQNTAIWTRCARNLRLDPMDNLVAQAAADGDNDDVRDLLALVCALTDMGFAAVARVDETRWIAYQVIDKIEFGLTPGGELEVQTTICDEMRQHGQAVVFDDATIDPEWRNHPVPILYGFKSYAAFPIFLPDGQFYGTLCAIDPARRKVSNEAVVATLRDYADQIGRLIAARHAQGDVRMMSA